MTYTTLAYWHLATVLPAFLIGAYLLTSRKGTPLHRHLGKLYMVLMAVTAIISLAMPARVGPNWIDHFGFVHGFSLLTLYLVPAAWLAIRRRDVSAHLANMVGLYVGGILIAGSFTLMPGRMIHGWLFG